MKNKVLLQNINKESIYSIISHFKYLNSIMPIYLDNYLQFNPTDLKEFKDVITYILKNNIIKSIDLLLQQIIIINFTEKEDKQTFLKLLTSLITFYYCIYNDPNYSNEENMEALKIFNSFLMIIKKLYFVIIYS